MPCCGQVSAVRSVRDRASLTRRAARGSHRRLTTLFTIQARSAWDSVLETGVYRPDPARQDAEGGWARFGYAWIRREMQKRIAAPPTSGIVWAWKRPRPSSTLVHWYLPPGAEGVFLELRVLSTRVLLSDYDAWEVAVQRQEPLTFSERSREALERKIDLEAGTLARLHRSWERMFDLDHRPFVTSAGLIKCTRVQACLVELRREDVVAMQRCRHAGITGRHPRGCLESHGLGAVARSALSDVTHGASQPPEIQPA